MNSKLKDVQVNSNGEKFSNTCIGDNIPDNVTSSSVHPENNHSSENNRTSLQVLVKDDERDLIELMIASSTIPVAPTNSGSAAKAKSDRSSGGAGGSSRSDAKKRAKQQRDLSRDLALLFPDNSKIQEEKAFNFAQAYFLKVRDRLDEQSFLEFLKVLSSFDNQSMTVCELYRKVISILEPYGELSEEFVAFLLPEQAMELGVYMEYLRFTKMRHFLRKLEVYFNKQPQQVRKIYECFARLADESSAGKTDMFAVRSVILPLLKGSSLLTEYFLQLFPFEQPSLLECSDNKDFEKIECGEFDESNSNVLQEDVDSWDWETVDIPDLDDPFGSDSCPCNCHSNSVSSISTHCFSCGIKFINGRVFVHSGKVLRPARLVIEGMNKKEIIERIGKKTVLKNDDKGANSFKHRKRPASDSSPVKNSSGANSITGNTIGANPGLLSPTGTELEEDTSESKPSSTKVKSPRTVRSGNVLKISRNKTLNNKDTVKDNSFTTEDEVLSEHSSVLLGNLNSIAENKESHSKDILCENMNDVVVKKEVDENIGELTKCVESGLHGSLIPLQSSRILIRDDEDDDIEYIEIDDDDGDDDVDVILDDDEDDDIEEDEEEITQNDDDEEDYEDIEVIEIDDDEERDMDVDYLVENNEDDNRDVSSTGDKIDNLCDNHKEKVKSDESDITKSNFCEGGSIIVKNEIPEEIVTVEIKSEDNDCDDKSKTVEPKFCSLMSEVDKEPLSETCFLNSNEKTTNLLDHDSVVSVKPSDEELSSTVSSPMPPPSHPTTFLSTSWTKEEDKVILQTFQQEGDTDENFIMIRNQLPQRSVEEIKVRFNILMQLLKRMTTNKNSTE